MTKWQRWEDGVRRRSYKALPHLLHSRVFGKPLRDLRLSEFSEMAWWAVIWAFAQLQPISPIYRRNLLLLTEYSSTSSPFVTAQ